MHWLSGLLSTVAFFQPDRVPTAHAYPRTFIPVSPQGKTGISLIQACARKSEARVWIPSVRVLPV